LKDETIEVVVGKMLKQNKTIATAESWEKIAQLLTSTERQLILKCVSYATTANRCFGVSERLINEHSVESRGSSAMALNVKR
jgi:nicotinamide mononucleotide (NMN) deamidase PncC